MREYKYKDLFYKAKETHMIICNICGQPIVKNEYGYFDDYIQVEKTWGYGSEFDGETHTLDICQHCYKKIFDRLIVLPIHMDEHPAEQ